MLALILLSMPVALADSSIDLAPKPGPTAQSAIQQGGSAMELLNSKPGIPPSGESSGKLKLRMTTQCTSGTGAVFKPGDAGYEGCLQNTSMGSAPVHPGQSNNQIGVKFGRDQ